MHFSSFAQAARSGALTALKDRSSAVLSGISGFSGSFSRRNGRSYLRQGTWDGSSASSSDFSKPFSADMELDIMNSQGAASL
jgi:hypothetical protein